MPLPVTCMGIVEVIERYNEQDSRVVVSPLNVFPFPQNLGHWSWHALRSKEQTVSTRLTRPYDMVNTWSSVLRVQSYFICLVSSRFNAIYSSNSTLHSAMRGRRYLQ